MRHKGFVIFLTVIISLLCTYYLSFTVVNRNINDEAIAYATDAEGNVDLSQKQYFLDSIWKKPVRNYLGLEYTYEEIKSTELGLGLDLQGGMHVTLEVSPVEIIKGLSSNNPNREFNAALDSASIMQRSRQEDYVSLFYEAWTGMRGEGELARIFATPANKDYVNSDSPDADVMDMIRTEVGKANARALQILRARIDRFGTAQPNIQMLPNSGRIQIELPGVENKERVRSLLQGVAKLEFFEVYSSQEYGSALGQANAILIAENQKEGEASTAPSGLDALSGEETTPAETTEDDALSLDDLASDSTDDGLEEIAADTTQSSEDFLNSQSILFKYAQQYGIFTFPIDDTMAVNRVIKRADIRNLFPKNLEFMWDAKTRTIEESGDVVISLTPIKTRRGEAPIEGDVIRRAVQDFDEKGSPSVSMAMTPEGAKKWRALTAANIGRQVAIVLDDYVFSAPTVQSEIPNGQSIITGNFTIDEAQDLASILEAGALPAPTRIVEEAVIGPSLGKVAQSQGIISVLAGLIIVVIFMIAYYAKGGLIANVALAFNVFFILGILASYSAALTLPGIAGIVLTIGMSIDANVIIFERIREEIRNGAGVSAAIRAGYKKAFASIFDANMTTLLVAVILMWLGQGPVKSFAITLLIGIVCSFFTAVYLTRVIVEFLIRNKEDQSKLSFATPFSKGVLSNINMNFMGSRKKAYIFSAAFIAVGVIVYFVNGGFNLGTDLSGGRSYVIEFNGKTVVPSELKVALGDDFEGSGVEVKTFDSNSKLKVTTSYLVYDETDEADKKVQSALTTGVTEFTGMAFTEQESNIGDGQYAIVSSTKVGATIADDIKSDSMKAILLALIIIFGYVAVRFSKWQFGLGAIVALVHDSAFVLSAFVILDAIGINFEIDSIVIAAILTVIGYSINDTVIVFDRIRETLGLRKTNDDESNFNVAINNTLSRTVITSFTTLVVILVLLIFGGEVLAGFSLALLVGVLIGTYSSVFIASPVVIDIPDGKSKKEATA